MKQTYKQALSQNNSDQAFAEVINSSLYNWQAQCWQWDYFPDFGSLVSIISPDCTIFGIVYKVQTGSSDPIRVPFAYQKTEEQLKQEQPHIFEFLKTTFDCLPLGYKDQTSSSFTYQVPCKPPKIHAFIKHTNAQDSKDFFADTRYLHVLFGHSHTVQNIDELLLAMLKKQSLYSQITCDDLLNFTQSFSLLTGNDYRRLKLFLQRISIT